MNKHDAPVRLSRTSDASAAGERELYVQAARMLGDSAAATRIAGVYAMAILADDWTAGNGQCVDSLCGYLRLPWVTGDPIADEAEAEVRRTLVRVIARRVPLYKRPDDTMLRWRWIPLDFTGARFPDRTDFSEAYLVRATFDRATFGNEVTFDRSVFSDDTAFTSATFGQDASFIDAVFGTGTTRH